MMSGEYCTLQEVKSYVPNIGTTTALDALIEELIVGESAFIDEILERDPTRKTYTETYSGEGGRLLAPNFFPIVSIASLSVDEVAWAQVAANTGVGFRFGDRFIVAVNNRFSIGFGNIVVTYTAGWADGEIPEQVRRACIELVAYRLSERQRTGIQSKSLAGESITYMDRSMPKTVLSRLTPFQSHIVSSSL